jgi:hypothetical protein
MPPRVSERRRELGRDQAQPSVSRASNPVLVLQRSLGNRAVGKVLARAQVRTGTVQIPGLGEIKVKGGNLDEWAGKAVLDTVEVTSEKGKHSAKLEQLSHAHDKMDIKVTISPANQAGENLSVGGGTLLEITDAHIRGYAIANGVEMWRIADFENVHRTKITHKIA